METVYWAPRNDIARARRAIQASAASPSEHWLGDVSDNRSNAPIAHILASRPNLRPALDALVAARGAGKAASFTLLSQSAAASDDPEVESLVVACHAAADSRSGSRLAVPVASSGRIFFDLTTSVFSSGPPTGMARLEGDLYRAFVEVVGGRIAPVAWNRQTGNFVCLPVGTNAEPIAPDALTAMESDGPARQLTRETVAPRSQLVTTGGTWTRRAQFIDALVRARSQCALQLTVLVHDLAQIRLKHLYPETAGPFEANARRLVAIADRFLVYSQATQSDLCELLADAELPFKPIARFGMGSTLGTGRGVTSVPVGLQHLEGKQFALYVSSIEPRKNHRMLVEVWRRLVAERGSEAPVLLCVGRPVMNGKDLIEEVGKDASVGPYIHFATGLHDEDLDWCYRNAAFTLYPSLYEGWGLPIAESLLHGKVCIASDASSMREVAPALTELVDPSDVAGWAEKISFYFDNPDERAAREAAVRAEYKPRPWRDSAREIVDALAVPPTMAPTACVQPFTSLTARAAEDSSRLDWVLGDGWAQSTKSGAAVSSTESSIAFTYLGTPRFALRLRFAARADIGAAQVDVEGGRVESLRRGSNALELTIDRTQAFGEVRLLLHAKPGTILVQIDVADSSEGVERIGGPLRPNPLLSFARRLLARLRRRPPTA